jgi:hypothetical protein
MNDRFAAELRQHLLTTANDRPADGQLAAVVERLAVTGQRRSLVARVTWFPGRIGPFPSTALRYGLLVAALIAATVAAVIFVAGRTPAASTVFEGTWTATDVGDNSTQTLVVGEGTSPGVHFEDSLSTGGACERDAVKVFTADGTGDITGNRLHVSFPNGGGCGLQKVSLGAGYYDHDAATDTLRDSQGLEWFRVPGGDAPATQRPAGPSPSPSTAPRSGDVTFTSNMHGISIDYPAGWQTRSATELWTGGALTFDSPAADVIFEPTLGNRLYLLLASQPYGGLTSDAWRDGVLAWTCPGYGGGEMWSWRVDGFSSYQLAPCNSGSIIATETRGYLIRLVASSAEPGLAETYNWDWLVPVLATVDLRPEEAAEAPVCIDYRDGGTYSQSVDPLTVTVTLPAGTDNGWWGGNRDVFAVGSDTCLFSAAVELEVSVPDRLYGEACKWRDAAVDVRSQAEAIATLSRNGLESTTPTNATIGGYPASRFEISIPADLTQCDGEHLHLWDSRAGRDAMIDPGQTVRVYLVDVDGVTLGVTVTYSPGDVRLPAHMVELDAILASLRIEP